LSCCTSSYFRNRAVGIGSPEHPEVPVHPAVAGASLRFVPPYNTPRVDDNPASASSLGLGVLSLFVIYVYIAFANRYLAEYYSADDGEEEEVQKMDSDEN